ncbi:hypothetical protein [Parasphingorhabdus sp.]|uniref:hypothetical protein n=1 Tax=Parasphingorhabdus sp. TaxID=2709688 RepID=UPI002F954C56
MADERGSHLAENSILLDRKGAVAYLTLNRPDAGNAINAPFARQLLKAAKTVEADSAICCLVVRAAINPVLTANSTADNYFR